MPAQRVLFEPWSLGDALIAAAALREWPETTALACNPRWHALLRAAIPDLADGALLAVDVPYTTRARTGRLHMAGASAALRAVAPPGSAVEVVSIRGDLRDVWAARTLFPGARLRVSGWLAFAARRSAVLNLPFAVGLAHVRNRYRAWATLLGRPFDEVEASYERRKAGAPRNARVVIHVGAQWRSRQYPHVAELRRALAGRGRDVLVLAGPSDPLPDGVAESDVVRATDGALVDALRGAAHVITNDSGPMHLAALLGCRTLPLAAVADIGEWVPPATRPVTTRVMPRGYRPRAGYMSDRTLPGWPDAAAVAEQLTPVT